MKIITWIIDCIREPFYFKTKENTKGLLPYWKRMYNAFVTDVLGKTTDKNGKYLLFSE